MRFFSFKFLPYALAAALSTAALAPAAAADATSASGAAAGKEFGNANKGIPADVTRNADPSTLVPGYGGDNPSQTGLFMGGKQSDLQGLGATAVGACADQTDPNCQAVNTMVQSPTERPNFNIKPDDPIIGNRDNIVRDPAAVAGDLVSTYETCEEVTITKPAEVENMTCNEYSVLEDKACLIGQAIQVDPDFIYKCQQTVQTNAYRQCTIGRVIKIDTDYNYKCNDTQSLVNTYTCKRILNASCTSGGTGCDAGGIIPSATESDMVFTWTNAGGGYYYLDWGTFANDYWTGPKATGKIYDRTLRFTVADKNKIEAFSFERAKFDDWMALWVNGSLVWVGPSSKTGGKANPSNWDRLELGAGSDASTSNYEYCYREGAQYRCNNGGAGGTYYPTAQCTCTIPGADEMCYQWKCGASIGGGGAINNVRFGPTAAQSGIPELGQNWDESLWIDVKSKLVTGVNTIKMRVIVAVEGEGWARFTTRQYCPSTCSTSWVNNCSALEARAR